MGAFDYMCEGQMSFQDYLDREIENYKIKKPVRLIELFGGIGAQSMALERLGVDFEHYRLVEFDKYPVASYNAIHVTNFEPTDITKIHAEDLGIADREKYTYLLTYSFPCQDISVAGLGKSLEKGSGTRSGLLWEVERLLDECGQELPQVLLMENVKNLLSKKHKEHFDKWCEYLNDKGYSNFYKVMNAKNFGVAQNRERVFMVSILGKAKYEFPEEIQLEKRMKDYLEDEVDKKYYITSQKAKELIDKLILEGKILNERTNERTNEQELTYAADKQKQLKSQTVSKQDTMLESIISNTTIQEYVNGNECEYGTTHYPHGWLGLNADFSGTCPTIDSGIWKHHTLIIEKEKK